MPEIKKNLNTAPYYDTTQQELEKGYFQVLAGENPVFQNREINVMSGLIYGNVKKITDNIIDDGSIISGCNFINNANTSTCILTSGEIYYNGKIITISETSFPYTLVPTGIALICIEVFQTIYTEHDDPSLFNPALNFEGAGEPGAHRIKYNTLPYIYTEAEFASAIADGTRNLIDIIKIYDRNMYGPIKPKPLFGKIYKQIAQRTYDTNGDFLVNGLETTAAKNKTDPLNKYTITISPGKGYIKGYEYKYETNTNLFVKSAIDTDNNDTSNIPEVKIFSDINAKYYLANTAVKSISTVYGNVTKIRVIMSFTGNVNPIPVAYTPTISINSVYDNIRTYTSGYSLVNNSIRWNTTDCPSGTYYADITYVCKFTNTVDYTYSKDSNGYYIQFTNTGIIPDLNSQISIFYEWYLHRHDLVYMKDDGILSVKTGIPNPPDLVEDPMIPVTAIPIAVIYVNPLLDPSMYTIKHYNMYTVPTTTLNDMKKRLNNVEYNIAMSKIEQETEAKHTEREDISTLKNIYVDSFVGYEKSDMGNHMFSSTVDIFDELCMLPLNIEKLSKSNVLFYKQDKTNAPEHGMLMLPYTSVVFDIQPYATHWIDVAPYYYKGLTPQISIDPRNSTDYEDTSETEVIWLPNRVIYSSRTVGSWVATQTSNSGSSTTTTWTDTSTGTTSNIVGEEIVSSKIEQISEILKPNISTSLLIQITGKDYEGSRNVAVLLEDEMVNAYINHIVSGSGATLTETTIGTESTDYPGCITTSEAGTFDLFFRVPENTPCGTKTVKVATILEEDEDSAYYKEAIATFTANSYIRHWLNTIQKRKIEEIITTTYYTRRSSTVSNTPRIDPIAQSFSSIDDIFITGIDLYFRYISSETDTNITFNIREMEDGYPTDTILYSKELDKDDIEETCTQDASKPFHIDFDYPIYIMSGKEYAFSIGANKNGYYIYYAKMGNRDLITNEPIVHQAHVSGVMFTSSNNNTWTAVQDSDVMYKLYRAEFSPSYTYYVPSIRPNDPTNYSQSIGNYALANFTIPNVVYEDTNISSYYVINSIDPYTEAIWNTLPIEEKIEFQNTSDYINNGMTMSLKFNLTTNNSKITPIINSNLIEIFLANYKNYGTYIQKSFTIEK